MIEETFISAQLPEVAHAAEVLQGAQPARVGATWCAKPQTTNGAAVLELTAHPWEVR